MAEIVLMAKVRFLGLDGLRGVCALSVVLYHCELLFRPGVVFCHGDMAVDMFFILSGFVIAANYDQRFAAGMTAGQFLAARIRRLAPVYWAGLALCFAAGLLTCLYVSTPGPLTVTLQAAMAAVLLPHIGPRSFAYPSNPVAWTLAWELVVNIAYAAGLRRLSTRPMAALIAFLLLAAIGESLVNRRGWSFGMTGGDIWLGGFRTFPEFLMGVMLLRAYRAGRLAPLPAVTPLLPVAAWLAIAVLPQTPPLLDAAIAILACPLLIALLVRGEAGSPGWFAPLGAISYPLYASHLAFISLARTTPIFGLVHHPDPARAVLVVLLALAAAWVIHLLAEPGRRSSRLSALSTGPEPVSGACLGASDTL
jgi:peptidoglycan/LPS O-acetylase OafA/YrhL